MIKTLKISIITLSILAINACSNASEKQEFSPKNQINRKEMNQNMDHPVFKKISEEEFYAGLNLTSDIESKVKIILGNFEDSMDMFMKSKKPPKKEEMDAMREKRDAKIKPLLTETQYALYKETIEGLFLPEHGERPEKPMGFGN